MLTQFRSRVCTSGESRGAVSPWVMLDGPAELCPAQSRRVHGSGCCQRYDAGGAESRGQVWCRQRAPDWSHVTRHMILSPPVGWAARLQALRSVPRNSRRALRNDSFKVRRWPEGDRTAGAMASIAPGAASPCPTGIPHPSEPPTSSQPERWRLPWRRRQCQPSTGIVHEKGNKWAHNAN